MTDIPALAIAYRAHADSAGVHPIKLVHDAISSTNRSLLTVAELRSPDTVLLNVLIDTLQDHVLLLRELNGVAE